MPKPMTAAFAAALLALAGPASAQMADPAAPMQLPGSVTPAPLLKPAPRVTLPSVPQTSAQVQQHLRSQGYTHIQNLHRTPDGWRAQAEKQGRGLSVRVDPAGRIERQ